MWAKVRALSLVAAFAAGVALLADAPDADACGCLSPPVPGPADGAFAVNQQAEQIIFEVEPGFVTARVLIRYAGDPAKFAWIVPVPAVPELSLSEASLFGLLDGASAPDASVSPVSICPSPEYVCKTHPLPNCPAPTTADSGAGSGGSWGSGGAAGGSGSSIPGEVTVISKQQIGSYDTVIFSAGDAQAAVDWLKTEGFIVNDTMTPFMQPYVAAGMLFVASKLVPGAGAEEIKPLKMRYAAENPMIPLRLTAVAAEPHLTVVSYILGSSTFAPVGHPLVKLDPNDLANGAGSRVNYPMLMSRAIDEAGGDAFVVEYTGSLPQPAFLQDGCCLGDVDICGLDGDAVCNVPGRPSTAIAPRSSCSV